MKKLFSIFIIAFYTSTLFSQETNLVSRQNYDKKLINSIKSELTFEDINIKRIQGDEISIEIYCNNLNKVPTVQNKDSELFIQSLKKKNSPGDYCMVILYLPVDFNPETFSIKTISGFISLKDFSSENDIELFSQTGNIDIIKTKSTFLSVNSISGNIIAKNISCDYFSFSTISGNISFVLFSDLFAKSKISSVSGNINFNSLSNSSYNFDIKQVKPNVNNKIPKLNNSEGIIIEIQNTSGYIQISS